MPDYKATLNLPRTDFAMKANLAQAEPQTVKRWQDEGLYAAVQGRGRAPRPSASTTGRRTPTGRSTWGTC